MPRDDVARALLVEDDQALRRLLTDELEDFGLAVKSAASVSEAEAQLKAWDPDVIITDLRLPGKDGLNLLEATSSLESPPAFVIITAFGTISQAVEALKAGADDFLTKPIDLERLRLSVTRSLERRRLLREVDRFRRLLSPEGFHGITGQSRPMQALFAQIRQVARGAGPVLILGESGVGKELAARAVHAESNRSSGPFLAVNCAGVPEALMESEFFGHTAGAFTGAERSRKGLLDQAEGGTLLLDEISETPLSMQAKLLRVLQEGAVRAVGSDREHSVDVRIVASSNRNLEQEVRASRFREDLFFRLETFNIWIPPLREREDDVDILAARFLDRFAARLAKRIAGLSTDSLERLRAYPFPGNVRELQNAMERAATFCVGDMVELRDLPARIRDFRTGQAGDGAAELPRELIQDGLLPSLSEVERRYMRYVLEKVGGNKRRAAALLGVSRRTLYRRLGELDA